MITHLLKLLLPKRAPAPTPKAPDRDPDFAAAWAVLADRAGRPNTMPVWAIFLRSPYEERPPARSWVGVAP